MTQADAHAGARATSLALEAEAERVLAKALDGQGEVAFVNFPNIDNPGDSAIYVGTMRLLGRLGVDVALAVEPRAYRRNMVRKVVGEGGTILIQGGGNLGDLYRKQGQQNVRARVLRDFPKARVIQLPQTMYFQEGRWAKQFSSLCEAHENLTMMLRDDASLARAEALGIPAIACPDLAFGMGPRERPIPADVDIAWLVREDIESNQAEERIRESTYDWPNRVKQRAGEAGADLARELAALRRRTTFAERMPKRFELSAMRHATRLYDSIADRRTALALELVAKGKVLVTDRLHGHLLACILGIPNVLLDNSYGKNRSVFDTWSRRYAIARFAEDMDDARSLAQDPSWQDGS